jgi:hypothetical protein
VKAKSFHALKIFLTLAWYIVTIQFQIVKVYQMSNSQIPNIVANLQSVSMKQAENFVNLLKAMLKSSFSAGIDRVKAQQLEQIRSGSVSGTSKTPLPKVPFLENKDLEAQIPVPDEKGPPRLTP